MPTGSLYLPLSLGYPDVPLVLPLLSDPALLVPTYASYFAAVGLNSPRGAG